MNRHAKVMFASFIYFAMVLEQNDGEVSESLMKLYQKLAKITRLYQKHLDEVTRELNAILRDLEKDVDYVLLSVTILAEYYDQLRGKKKHFCPMSHKAILALQEECLELDDSMAIDTCDVAELIVRELLNDKR